MLSIWVTRRSTRRKLLLVIRTMVAMAVAWPIPPSAVVPVAGSRWVRTAVSSSGVSCRYSWAKPMRL